MKFSCSIEVLLSMGELISLSLHTIAFPAQKIASVGIGAQELQS